MNGVLECDTCPDSNEPVDIGACAKCANHYLKRAVKEHEAAMSRGYMSRSLNIIAYDKLKAGISRGMMPGLDSWRREAKPRPLLPAPEETAAAEAPAVEPAGPADAPGLVDCPHYDGRCALTGQRCLLADDPAGACSIRKREESKAQKITIKK